MIDVFFRPAPFSLEPFVRSAVEQLGYVRADSVRELAMIFEKLWPNGISASMLIYNELEVMTIEEKRAVGAPRTRMPICVWNLLSASGRADADRAIRETTTCVILAVQKEWARRNIELQPKS